MQTNGRRHSEILEANYVGSGSNISLVVCRRWKCQGVDAGDNVEQAPPPPSACDAPVQF